MKKAKMEAECADAIKPIEFEDPGYDFKRGKLAAPHHGFDMTPASLGVKSEEDVNHPQHYGGDTTYEVIKVIEAWKLGFNLGNTVKYIGRAGKKGLPLNDLKKAAWYLKREIESIEGVAMPGEPTPYLQATGVAEFQRHENASLDVSLRRAARDKAVGP